MSKPLGQYISIWPGEIYNNLFSICPKLSTCSTHALHLAVFVLIINQPRIVGYTKQISSENSVDISVSHDSFLAFLSLVFLNTYGRITIHVGSKP